jgi:hypothetical protein
LTRADAQIASIRPPEYPFAANSLTAARKMRSRVPSVDFAAFGLDTPLSAIDRSQG